MHLLLLNDLLYCQFHVQHPLFIASAVSWFLPMKSTTLFIWVSSSKSPNYSRLRPWLKERQRQRLCLMRKLMRLRPWLKVNLRHSQHPAAGVDAFY